jgi:hypothetical protein
LNSVKYFAALELPELVKGRAWPAKITNALNLYWQKCGQEKRVDGRTITTAFFLHQRDHGRVMPGGDGSAVGIRSRVAFPDLIIWNRTNPNCPRQKGWVKKTTIL